MKNNILDDFDDKPDDSKTRYLRILGIFRVIYLCQFFRTYILLFFGESPSAFDTSWLTVDPALFLIASIFFIYYHIKKVIDELKMLSPNYPKFSQMIAILLSVLILISMAEDLSLFIKFDPIPLLIFQSSLLIGTLILIFEDLFNLVRK